ncbi:hypothetical protein [Roseimicrobium sp. ORNL1]|uniref:hypothetical protein n=1 Tax=Roseimicrobium sp. ORNL1 TaxID=2711231 RepID=UPI0013E14C3F|nr:hypothetical protein [Roseimicrobium sp. ORNL1]QIF04148.1 hypothetical protein G5S37_22340 [Roseimicrobium sp. ORNL1]
MIILDQSIPFVRAALGGSLDEATAILKSAEQRHGLRWTMSSDTLDESNDADAWYQEHLWPFLTETHFVLSGGDLALTGCSLFGADGLNYSPSWRHWGGILAAWANQHWMSRPAGLGSTNWTRASRPWEYLDFYSHDYLSYAIADYDYWLESIGKILRLSNEMT